MSLASLYISESPAAFAGLAEKHNRLVDVLAALEGAAGIKITITDRNIVVQPDLDALATALATSSALYDMAYNASIDAAAAGQFNTHVNIPAAQVTDFDAAAVAAVLPIAPSDVTGFNAAASAAAPVQSVAGRTGAVVLTSTDLSDFAAAASGAAPVQSVAGRNGNVVLAWADLTDVSQETIAVCDLGNINFLTV